MVQIARPTGDAAAGGWTNQAGAATNLYQSIDEASASEADYVQSSVSPATPDVYKATLSPLVDPVSSAGHVVRYRIAKSETGGDPISVVVRLMQGSTQIASWAHHDVSSTITPVAQTLTGAQADAITDYAALALTFEARIGLPTPTNNLVAGVGDSITAAGGSATAAQLSDAARVGAYQVWACILPKTGDAMGNGKMQFGGVYATSGFKTSQIHSTLVSTWLPALLARNPVPSFVLFLAGANDASSGIGGGGVIENGVFSPTNFAAWQAEYVACIDLLVDNGIVPVTPTLMPNNSATYGTGVADYMNPWIRSYAAERGMACPEIWEALRSGNGYAAGYNLDGTHPSVLGAKVAGQVVRDAIDAILPDPAPTIVTSATQGDAEFVWMNGALTSDTDADNIPDGGATPTLDLDPWTITANGATLALAPRTIFSGNAWRINKTTDPGDTTIISGSTAGVPPNPAAGNRVGVGLVCEVASWAVDTSIVLQFRKVTDSAVQQMSLNLRTDAAFTGPVAPFVWYQEAIIPASYGGGRWSFTIGGTGTSTADLYLGQLTVRDMGVG